ncbi:MAG: ABC transporter permease [Thermomicrobiales bacterium]
MTAYIIRRLLLMIPVAFLVSVMIFLLLHLTPGDPIAILFGEEPDPTVIANVRHQYGLDRPIPIQYANWIGRFLHGDMGRSLRTRQPVTEAIFTRLPATLELGLAALCFSLLISIPIGILSATKRNSVWDLVGTSFPLLGVSIPNFFSGIMLILLFSLTFRIFSPGGYTPFKVDAGQNLKHLVLPMIALATPSIAVNMRFMRSGLIDALGQEYIRVARAKGLGERAVVIRHALKNAFIPFVTVVGLQVGALLEGAFITETIFLWPGVGRLAVDSIGGRDYPVVQGIVLLSALSFMTVNLIVDVLYAFLDPRIKYG